MPVVKLANGLVLPPLGLGTNTFGKVDHNWNGEINFSTTEIVTALQAGYRFLDTAIVYRNEEVVGLALKESGLAREEVIVQTKLPVIAHYIKDEVAIRSAVQDSLARLDTHYIDILLIHQPRPSDEENLRIYQVLEALVDEGKVRHLGVSNFSISQLDYLLKHSRIKPILNQIEIHPGYWNEELVDFCLAHHVLAQAWSPLFRTSKADQKVLESIASQYHKSWAQIVIAYMIEKGIHVIVKSHDEKRQKENLNVFDFSLTAEDKARIAALNIPNFRRLGLLGGTGLIGKVLTMEALRMGYEVVNVSLDGAIMPQRHLEIIKHDIKQSVALASRLEHVDALIVSLNDEKEEEYLYIHLKAIEIARRIQKPLIVVGTSSVLYHPDKRGRLIDEVEASRYALEKARVEVLDLLSQHRDIDWTYLAPARHIDTRHIHQPYNLGGDIMLKDKDGQSRVGIIDLVDVALLISDQQDNYHHQVVSIASR